MNSPAMPLPTLCDAAMSAARSAGEFIQSVDRSQLQRQYKAAGSSAASQLVTATDVRSEAIIHDALRDSCEQWNIAFVGEESAHEQAGQLPARLRKPYFWCVDPLDGTLPFVEGGDGYAVSIALLAQSGRPLLGVVYDPVSATLMHAMAGEGAYRSMAAMQPPTEPGDRLIVMADASFSATECYEETVAILKRVAADSGLDGIELVYGNGAVKNACKVLEHPFACYLKLPRAQQGGGSIWDFAASACIAREAGAWASNIHGKALDLNRRDSTFMNHQGVLYASSEKIARDLLTALSPGA